MRAAELLPRALYFGLLLSAAAIALRMPTWVAAPGVVFVLLAVWAHAAARLIGATGAEKGMLFLEAVPFFAFACVQLGQQNATQALLGVTAGTAVGAAILAWEALVARGQATFTSSVGFILACCLAGFGFARLPARLFLGLALVALLAAGYGLVRRGSP